MICSSPPDSGLEKIERRVCGIASADQVVVCFSRVFLDASSCARFSWNAKYSFVQPVRMKKRIQNVEIFLIFCASAHDLLIISRLSKENFFISKAGLSEEFFSFLEYFCNDFFLKFEFCIYKRTSSGEGNAVGRNLYPGDFFCQNCLGRSCKTSLDARKQKC